MYFRVRGCDIDVAIEVEIQPRLLSLNVTPFISGKPDGNIGKCEAERNRFGKA